jgi:adenine C2-methylase RlmN of 23S rRNA A2503 and tRNA A37
MLKSITLYNEKGNIAAKVRNELKDETMPVLVSAVEGTLGADGAIYVPVATNERGETVYARLEVTISIKDPSTPKPSKAKAE